jgi:DNA-binding PadR family transcriptional regulator
MGTKVNESKLNEWYDKGLIKVQSGKSDGASDYYYVLTDAGKKNLSDNEKKVILYNTPRVTKNHQQGRSSSDASNAYQKGVDGTYSTPSAGAQIAKAEQDRAAAQRAADQRVQQEQQAIQAQASTDTAKLNNTVSGLLAQLAQQQQPDYAGELTRALDTQRAQMKSEWEAQRQQAEASYKSQMGVLTSQMEQQKKQWEADRAENQRQQTELKRQIEVEANRTGRFDASVLDIGIDEQEDEALLSKGQAGLAKLKQVYAFDPTKQAEIEQQYGGLLTGLKGKYDTAYNEAANTRQAGLGQFVSGNYKLTELPSLYGKQSAFNQALQAKQQGLFSQLANLQNVSTELERRAIDDQASIQAQRLQEKQSLSSQLAAKQYGQQKQQVLNQSATRNVRNIARRVGSGILSQQLQGR